MDVLFYYRQNLKKYRKLEKKRCQLECLPQTIA